MMENMTSDSAMTKLCAAAEAIRNNTILWYLLVSELLLITIAVLLCSAFLYLIYRHAYIHINARLLLANLTFNVLLAAIVDIAKTLLSVFKFARYSRCDLLESYEECQRKTLPDLIIDHAMVFSVFALIVERACATLFARSYEKKVTKKIVIALIVLQWCVAFGCIIFMVASCTAEIEHKKKSEVQLVFTCSVSYTQPQIMITSHLAATLVYATFILILVGIILFNRHKYSVAYVNKTKHTQNERYQLHENVRGTRLLLPGIGMLCIMSLGNMIVLVIVENGYHSITDETERIILMYPIYEGINLLIAICTLLYPILSTVFSSLLVKAVWDMIRCKKQQNRIIVQENVSAEKQNIYTKQGVFRPIPLPTASKSTHKHFTKLTTTWENTFHRKVGVASAGDSLSDTMPPVAT